MLVWWLVRIGGLTDGESEVEGLDAGHELLVVQVARVVHVVQLEQPVQVVLQLLRVLAWG